MLTSIGSNCTFDTDGNCSGKQKNSVTKTNKSKVINHTVYAVVNCNSGLLHMASDL